MIWRLEGLDAMLHHIMGKCSAELKFAVVQRLILAHRATFVIPACGTSTNGVVRNVIVMVTHTRVTRSPGNARTARTIPHVTIVIVVQKGFTGNLWENRILVNHVHVMD